MPQADAAHAALMTAHRAAIAECRSKLAALPVIGSDVPLLSAETAAPVE